MFRRLTSRRGSQGTRARFLSAQERRALACTWPKKVQQRAITLVRMLRPFEVQDFRKIRVGGDEDGGYVMVDDFVGVETAFSLGVGPNVDWDFEIAERDIPVHQFDHTVDGPPRSHPGFHFHPRMIAPSPEQDADTLVTMLDHAVTHRPASSILKMDIEAAEWAVLASAAQSVFEKFSQILCEFHAFEYLHLDEHFENAIQGMYTLKQQFEVVHVHANNSAGITFVDEAPIPFVLEASLVNRTRYRTRPGRETFPTPLDRPNDKNRPDYELGRFDI